MMKISKPVLMNDFMVNHVQFTSLNLVSFKNIKPVYDGNEKIQLEYEHPSKVEVSSRDWIGIFPRGWSNLQQYITFEWISLSKPEPSDSIDITRRTIPFCPKYHMNCVNQSAFYQFVYVGKQIEVLGVSSYFRFDLTCLNDSSLEIECLVPVTGKVRSTSVSDFGAMSMTNEQSSTSIESRKLFHASSIHSLQNLDVDGKITWSRMNFTDDKKNLCLMKRTGAFRTGTGDSLNPYGSHSEPGFPMSLPQTQCKKCYQFKRGGDAIRSQQALQSKLKIVMERNKVLEERAQDMKKELDRLQVESKRMKMTYYNVNKEKTAYEKFVKDFIKSLEKDSIVRVMYGNTEILVKKVNYVGMEEHPRDKKTSKRERELKAVIGLQEITIRNLINSLQEKAKSVEELNQTVKLAQVFSAGRTDSTELGMDAEESADELSNSDVTSEYEFSLAKPSPPEEVAGEADDVLDTIRRTSEMELKDIGLARSLVNNSDLDVTNLSVMAYDSDNAESKNGVEECWPFPRNTPKTLRQKLSEDSINVNEPKNNVGDADDERPEEEASENEGELDVDATNCEDYYDAYDAFSVRSFSPENGETQEEDMMLTTVAPEETKPAEKCNKFTCELSIDFVQRRCQMSDRMICEREEVKPEEKTLAICQPEANGTQVYTVDRERSLITFTKSEKGLEIKITKVDQSESSRGFHQKMVLEFAGTKANDTAEIAPMQIDGDNPALSDETIESKEDASVESEDKNVETDAFSPRTVWNDANDDEENQGERDEEPTESGDEKQETEELREESNCQTLTEDDGTNLKAYQDSLRYERNLQFLNRKFDGDSGKEGDDKALKDKPSAILIQTAQEKVAVIRLP